MNKLNPIRITCICIFILISISGNSLAKNNVKSASNGNKQNQSAQQNSKKSEDLSDDDRKFIELREAARKNDLLKANQFANQLSNYEISDYVEYFKIKPRLYDSSSKSNSATDADLEVKNFLKKYKSISQFGIATNVKSGTRQTSYATMSHAAYNIHNTVRRQTS